MRFPNHFSRSGALVGLCVLAWGSLAGCAGSSPSGTPTPTLTPGPTATATLDVPTPAAGSGSFPSSGSNTSGGSAVCSCEGDFWDCATFQVPESAQECFDYCWQLTRADVHLLDADQDQVVCESRWPNWRPSRVSPTYAPPGSRP